MRKWLERDWAYGSFWIGLVVLLFFFPVLLGRQSLAEAVPTFYSYLSPDPQIKTPWQVDGATHTVDTIPLVRASVSLIKEGVPPLWASYSGGGQPLMSNLMNGLYYPLRLVFFLLWNSAHAFDWYFLLRFFIAGLGMFLYLRTIGLRRLVSLWGGIAYSFSGYFMLYLTYPFLDVDALLPWMLWAIERHFQNNEVRFALLFGFLLACTIAIGHPQTTIVAALFVVLYGTWRIYHRRDKLRGQWLGVWGRIGLAMLVALLVASPFIIEFLVHYRQGQTADYWNEKGLLAFPPLRLLHFIISPTMTPEVALGGHLLDRFELIIPYAGMSVFLLFLASFFIKQKPFPLAPLYAWIGFVVLKNAGFPLLQWIGALPVFGQIGWYKAYGPMAGALVICAGIAFETILRADAAAIRWRRFSQSVAVIPLLFIAAYLFAPAAFRQAYVPNFDLGQRNPALVGKITGALTKWPSSIRAIALEALQSPGYYFTIGLFAEAILFAGLAFLIIYFLRVERYRKRAVVAMLFLTIFELWWYMPKVRDGFRYVDQYAESPPYVKFLRGRMAKDGVSRTFSLGDVFAGHIGELYRIQKSQNSYAVKSRRYVTFLPDVLSGGNSLTSELSPEKISEVPEKFFDAFNVRYLLSEKPLPATLERKLIYDADIKIYENKTVLPKAYIAFQKRSAASPEEARAVFYGESFDPHAGVVLEDRNAVTLRATTAAPIRAGATVK